MKGESIARVRKQAAVAGANRARAYMNEGSLHQFEQFEKRMEAYNKPIRRTGPHGPPGGMTRFEFVKPASWWQRWIGA